ncbi:ubiquitin protein ligase E3 component n-recognin 7 L homeolog isoform X1 [Xenopus laevis]|uniref:Putative E3 ubiquitin-protein ligase UBR7 n=2 Tax=Xenopus laevis TaxID=8355 RepID=A0A1L8F9I5_XENLA|nr:ubiquitin protein ligase E3 component n-recognin 7 L homeolog isoform X1 [Xenopus laevis]OCT68260.1 hypothetical protein XELAEV_18039558mg [Xenopus laevis]
MLVCDVVFAPPTSARQAKNCFSRLLIQMAANGQPEKQDGGEGEEPVLSLLDVLEEDDALEDEACAVLGACDAEKCSYPEGYVRRQALYACNTCTPNKEDPAGICLACSYKCHEGHDLFELYTKRNFQCDCGNAKFKQLECKLFPEKENCNSHNKYNHNFFGVYCTCKRPYPDPEDEVPDEMIQCIVCEDWFHGRHLGAVPPEHMDFQEMVCQICMDRCSFLWAYAAHIAIPPVTKITSAEMDPESEDIKVDDSLAEGILGEDGPNIKTEEQKEEITTPGIKEEDKPNGASTSAESEQKCGDDSHLLKAEANPQSVCKLKEMKMHPISKANTATYWPSNWRSKLCTCDDCKEMYTKLEVLFLLDENDTVQAYENKGKTQQATERRDPLMTALSSMNRVQQVELICEYNDLKTELTDYLKRFAEEGKVVKTEDIQQFFEELRSRKRRRLDGMQYYCS